MTNDREDFLQKLSRWKAINRLDPPHIPLTRGDFLIPLNPPYQEGLFELWAEIWSKPFTQLHQFQIGIIGEDIIFCEYIALGLGSPENFDRQKSIAANTTDLLYRLFEIIGTINLRKL
jgi:hypothetical protein